MKICNIIMKKYTKNEKVYYEKDNFAYDMRSGIDIYKGEKTVDGSGRDLGSPTVIEWLNSHTLDKNADTSGELPDVFYRFFHENVKNFSRVILIKIILRLLDTFGYIDLY